MQKMLALIRIALLCLLLLLVVTPLWALAPIECPEDDTECLRRCRPGSVGELQSRLVERNCPNPIKTRMESQLRCWIGKVPEHPTGQQAKEITNISALLTWTHSTKWPNVTRLHYECHLAMEKYLALFFDKQLLTPKLGNVPTVQVRDDGVQVTNSAVRVVGLRPGQTYNCFLWTEFHDIKGAKALVKFTTMASVPAFPVSKLQLNYDLLSDSIILNWRRDRPKVDSVTGYKLIIGTSMRVLDQNEDRFEISLDWWNKLLGVNGLINVTMAPFNAVGSGPEIKASVMPPPYDDYYLSNKECRSQDRVYIFQDPRSKSESNNACYKEVFYKECSRQEP